MNRRDIINVVLGGLVGLLAGCLFGIISWQFVAFIALHLAVLVNSQI